MNDPLEALAGITILDLGRVLSAPFCGAILAEFGAQVYKIEHPDHGDETRDYLPKRNGESGYFINFNRGKKGLTLDLKKGKALFLDLVRRSDVLIENFRPGVMKRLGLDYEELSKINPRLIYTANSGFGQSGPYAQRAGYDTMAQAMSGLMSATGADTGRPTRVGASVADVMAGLQAVVGILAALRYRDRTGKGQLIDVALVDASVVSMAKIAQDYFTVGKLWRQNIRRFGLSAPECFLKTKDGYVVLCDLTQTKWARLCLLMGQGALSDDPKFASTQLRFANQEQQDRLIELWTITKKTDTLLEILSKNGLAAAPVCDIREVVQNEQIQSRNMFVEVVQPLAGKMRITNNPIRMSVRGPVVKGPAPLQGEHNQEVYSRLLGLSDRKLEILSQEGVI